MWKKIKYIIFNRWREGKDRDLHLHLSPGIVCHDARLRRVAEFQIQVHLLPIIKV